MFSRLRAFVSRHKRKFVVAGVLIGSAVLLSRYVRKALKDWQERETKDFIDRTRKQQHYESVERACNYTAITMIPTMKESIASICDTEILVGKLKEGNCNKVEVWEELKHLAFSKVTLLVYTSSILMVTLRLQLNLIGAYMFKTSMNDIKAEKNNSLHEKYLALTKFLLTEGVKDIASIIQTKVKLVLQSRSLKEKLSIQDIEQIFWAIDSAINNDPANPSQRLPSLVLPNSDQISLPEQQNEIYKRIISETRDLLESDEIISLTKSSISRGFSNFVDKIAEYFILRENSRVCHDPNMKKSGDDFFSSNMPEEQSNTTIRHTSIPMAKVIPIVNGLLSTRESKSDVPYTWMQQLILMDELKVLGANVYEGFSV